MQLRDCFWMPSYTFRIKNANDYKLEYLYMVNKFKLILQRDFKIAKKVSHYANELNMTSRKLTEITEYITNKSSKQIILKSSSVNVKRLFILPIRHFPKYLMNWDLVMKVISVILSKSILAKIHPR